MKKYNIWNGKDIVVDDKINNSFFLYNTIFENKNHLRDKLISFCSNVNYSCSLFLIKQEYFILDIYKNVINKTTEDVDVNFTVYNKIKLELSSLEFNTKSDEEIEMYFLSEKYILLENVMKRTIILDHQTGAYITIILKGKKSQRKNLLYNPGQTSGDDLFKDDSNVDDKIEQNKEKDIEKNSTLTDKLNMKYEKKKDKNRMADEPNFSGIFPDLFRIFLFHDGKYTRNGN